MLENGRRCLTGEVRQMFRRRDTEGLGAFVLRVKGGGMKRRAYG